jgi:hypothetical protein
MYRLQPTRFKVSRCGLAALFLLSFMLLSGSVGLSFSTQGAALVCGYCGQAIRGKYIRYEKGPVYHQDCHAAAKRCRICGLPIGRNQKIRLDAEKHAFHAACYQAASLCEACGQPIVAGQSYRQAQGEDSKWHAACFETATFCGITGNYIHPGTPIIQIGSETFLKSAYDQADKCLVSTLPLANHGRHIVNRRSSTYVLEAYKKYTRQCYSCGDWLNDGFTIEAQFFLCTYCYRNSIRDRRQAEPHVQAAIGFFKARGITVPDNLEIVVLPPGRLVAGQFSTDMKGACNTSGAAFVGKTFYKHVIEILYGLNAERFVTTLVHEMAHAVIAEEIKYVNGKEQKIPYEEGRCEFAAYLFARENNLPDYIIAGFAANRVAAYREGFMHYKNSRPVNLTALLTTQ